MAESNATPNNTDNVFSANDPLDINELASLNEEISNDFIDQLQSQIATNANIKSKNDGDLFEETSEGTNKQATGFNKDIDDNFIKKYKAKLKKKQDPAEEDNLELKARSVQVEAETETLPEENISHAAELPVIEEAVVVPPVEEPKQETPEPETKNIESITGGNITEKPLTKEAVDYNESLDFLDNNVKYSKYVIYIEPENKDFIDSLTVKERKNLINKIIKEQDSIAMTKRKFGNLQTIITHAIIAVITFTIAIPCIYWTINASLEATINNYRSSQVIFSQLYKEHGKISTKKH